MRKKKKRFYDYDQARATVQRLQMVSVAQYKKEYSQDPKLPGRPDLAYAGTGWADWYTFLGKTRETFYPTFDEARASAQGLGVQNRFQYGVHRRKDSRLPSHPHVLYSGKGWTTWRDFLGIPAVYPTLEEAQNAVRKLNIKNITAYRTMYRLDPRLPRVPDVHFRHLGWIGWFEFLGSSRVGRYETYAEAQAAAKMLGITNSSSYMKLFAQDPMLPRHPYLAYAGVGWTNWSDFLSSQKLEPYQTYTQAESAARLLDLKSSSDYLSRYMQDPKLPSSPNRLYAKDGWVDWYTFLGFERRSQDKPDRDEENS